MYKLLCLFLEALVLSFITSTAAFTEEISSPIPQSAEDTKPLSVGNSIPDASLSLPDGTRVKLKEIVAESPALIIFYRGGWCPYCTGHLGELAEIEADLKVLGFQTLAISPDKPEILAVGAEHYDFPYTLLSDSAMDAAKGFGLAFQVDADTVSLYKNEYSIDLEEHSGQTHHLLPVPAAYLVSGSGEIKFAHTDPDYKSRVDLDELKRQAHGIQ